MTIDHCPNCNTPLPLTLTHSQQPMIEVPPEIDSALRDALLKSTTVVEILLPAKTYEDGLREAAEVADKYRENAGGDQQYRQACAHISSHILALLPAPTSGDQQ